MDNVAPFAGAWIEIVNSSAFLMPNRVAPFAGAWIEIMCQELHVDLKEVAPFAGAWIEICSLSIITTSYAGRSLRGSVD